jgi:mono/diheme cytochrome c family protein
MSCSQSAGFGVMMAGLQRGLEEIAVGSRFASAMILLAALAPPAAYAQVNIDQGKAPAQIYDSDCAACHKSIRGLANGRGASALTSFLAEHYTSSSKEAAALAAYVLSGGGGVGAPAPAHPPKIKPEPTTASVEEPKDREVKRPAKPEGDQQGPAPKSQRPSGSSQRPEGTSQKPDGTSQKPEGTAVGEPGSTAPDRKPVPAPGRREPNTGTGMRVRGQPPKPLVEPSPAPSKPTVVVVVPSPPESPSPGASAAVPEPSEAPPGGDAPVPRDNIPD